MRFKPLARRIILAPMLAVALALTVAACSSSSSSTSASSSASSTPAASSPAATGSSAAPSSSGGTSSSAAVAQITANWEKFFSSSIPVSEKVNLLQNGSTFEAAIKAFANFPLASSLGAKVTNVTVNSATSATVTYSITTSSGSTLLPNQKGTAVYQDGVWKVGDASLCGLLKLVPGSTAPAACNSVG
jgi:glucose/arabinose dehydrogenase